MSHETFLVLPGGPSLTPFQGERLLARAQSYDAQIQRVQAWYIHLVDLLSPLNDTNRRILDALLDTPPSPPPLTGWVVVPRLGTISPWSTKATNIAHNAGLSGIRRLERGILYQFHTDGANWQPGAEIRRLLHDRMTQEIFPNLEATRELFATPQPRPLTWVDIQNGGLPALQAADHRLGLALSREEQEYLVHAFSQLGKNPTDVELMMFAQANSEHCRHKIFNASWTIDGQSPPETLFGMIRHTEAISPQGTLSAYQDNAAIMQGGPGLAFYPDPATRQYQFHEEEIDILMKVETHNHPTAISPFPGAATGSGGELRDEGATGIGGSPKGGLTGFCVSNLLLPDARQPWEIDSGRPDRIVSALEIMLEGPLGAAAFNNEFGRPALGGYFRTYEMPCAGEIRGYHKPIMIAGGLGNVFRRDGAKKNIPPGALIVQIGGPAMLIGLGGGAASSQTSGSGQAELDFASVQRENPEMQRRCQEVIQRCRQLRENNPILSIHDVGAGGLANAVPEIMHGAGLGGRLQLQQIPNADPGMSPMELWCNESQERYVLAIAPENRERFADICSRERCPWAVLGVATQEKHLILEDATGAPSPIDIPMDLLFGKPPRMHRDVTHACVTHPPFVPRLDFSEALERVLSLPTVADKGFLITIGDRSVTGMVCRDPMVSPWQVPVADVAVMARGYEGIAGEAMAMGERPPVALVKAAASARLAVAEAITNLAAAAIDSLSRVKLSANWMAPAGHPGEDANLFDAVRAVGLELCPALGVGIPVGKDSLSLKTVWREGDTPKAVTAPVSLVITAFAPVADIRRTLTPQLQSLDQETDLVLVDLGRGKNRLAASALAQVHGEVGSDPADLDHPDDLRRFFAAIQTLNREGLLLSYHDKGDGGLVVTLLEMAFAGHCGLQIDISQMTGDPQAILFNEEPGAVLQILRSHRQRVLQQLQGIGEVALIGAAMTGNTVRICGDRGFVYESTRTTLHRIWSKTSWHMRTLRDNPATAKEEYDRLLVTDDPGMTVRLSFDPTRSRVPSLKKAPQVAILREQGINGQVEMAAAFHRAGFTPVDITMTDLLANPDELQHFSGLAACGGFSYGDVLGAGVGWARTILFHPRLKEAFQTFFQRSDTFTLGVCNGCQMLSQLKELIPGAHLWPIFKNNVSARFEARFVSLAIPENRSVLLAGMAGSVLPVPVAHGEGRAVFQDSAQLQACLDNNLIVARYADGYGNATECYPSNPNGSVLGIAGVTTLDGRATILMPHPERVFRSVTHSWYPDSWGEDGPWLRLFTNAKIWLEGHS
ncbi:MAG: phosphoribosylformylglycinamidine synthase [Magnetococcales bacterium]|nr:phosphoribosylformylglycinamidine synthase [Magnetococcales bacterium]MBF0419951.1 phosphoribosylformylglycinamidine synthase [Magnetococcales bacterium]